MAAIQSWLIQLVVTWLVGVTKEQWQAALAFVEKAAKNFIGGHLKNEWVKSQLLGLFPVIEPYVLNALIEIAVVIQKWLGKA